MKPASGSQTTKADSLSLLRNIGVRTLIKIPIQIASLVAFPLFVLAFRADEFGIWAQVQVALVLFPHIVGGRLERSMQRFLTQEEDDPKVLGAIFSVVVVQAVSFICLAWLLKNVVAWLLFGSAALGGYVGPLALWISARAVLYLIIAYFKGRQCFVLSSIVEGGIVAVRLTVAVIAIMFALTLDDVLMVFVLSESLFAAVLLIMGWRKFSPVGVISAYRELREYFRFSTPLIANQITTWVLTNLDRLMLLHYLGLEVVGSYYVVRRISELLSEAVTPVHYVLFPTLAKLWNTGRQAAASRLAKQSLNIVLVIAIPGLAGLVLLAQDIGMVLAPGYYVSYFLVLLLCISVALDQLVTLFVSMLQMAKRTRTLLAVHLCAAGPVLILTAMLTQQFGIVGASISRMVGAAFVLALMSAVTRNIIRFRLETSLLVRVLAAAGAMVLVISVIPVHGAWRLLVCVPIGSVVYTVMGYTLHIIPPKLQLDVVGINE